MRACSTRWARAAFSSMVARGSVVDEAALIAALRDTRFLSAGLDVFVWRAQDQPAFLELDNVTLFPHIGSASIHTRGAMGQLVVDNLVAFAAGKAAQDARGGDSVPGLVARAFLARRAGHHKQQRPGREPRALQYLPVVERLAT